MLDFSVIRGRAGRPMAGGLMACRRCGSQTQHELDGELSASLPTLKGLGISPIYASQRIVVCFDCGLTELTIPVDELERLKKALSPPRQQDSR